MKKYLVVFALLAGTGASGCVVVAAGAAGATVLACTEKELNCPLD